VFSLRDRNAPLAALLLSVALFSQRAGAEPESERAGERAQTPARQRVTCPTVAVFAVEGELECLPQPPVLDRSARGATLEPTRAPVRRDDVGYRALMGELVITRDLEIPGLTGVGVRMIPSRSAVVGSPVPVVLIPRFVGTSWYGAEVVATF